MRELGSLAVSLGWVPTNVANGEINAALAGTAKRHSTGNYRSMPHALVGAWLRALAAGPIADLITVLVLTAARLEDFRSMTWDEVDGDTWTVSGERHKTGAPDFTIPLTAPVLAILELQRGQHDRFVFPSMRVPNRPISAKVIRAQMHAEYNLHGFRGSFKGWAAETGIDDCRCPAPATKNEHVRGACAPATPGSDGTTSAGALTCTGCWDCAGCWCVPASRAANLASHVLGRAARAVGDDCERLHGYRRWLLETFVDEAEHTGGACARRTGFGWVRPAGAGTARTRRPKRARRCMCTRWNRRGAHASRCPHRASRRWRRTRRRVLGGPRVRRGVAGRRAPARTPGPERATYGTVSDARHHRRHQRSTRLGQGHYRLIDQPADGAVTVDNILAPHRECTLRRMRAHDTVLCIQDGTRLNFTRRSHRQGLGTIGSNQTGAVARGLHLHATLAVNPDGMALGVLRAAFDAPAPEPRRERQAEAARGAQVVPLGRGALRLAGERYSWNERCGNWRRGMSRP